MCNVCTCAGFIKTNLMRSNASVGLREDSPYNQFKHVGFLVCRQGTTGYVGWRHGLPPLDEHVLVLVGIEVAERVGC